MEVPSFPGYSVFWYSGRLTAANDLTGWFQLTQAACQPSAIAGPFQHEIRLLRGKGTHVLQLLPPYAALSCHLYLPLPPLPAHIILQGLVTPSSTEPRNLSSSDGATVSQHRNHMDAAGCTVPTAPSHNWLVHKHITVLCFWQLTMQHVSAEL